MVSNADLHHTYKHLFSEEPAAQRTTRRLGSRWTGRCRCSSCISAPTAPTATQSRITPCCSGRATERRFAAQEIFHGSVLARRLQPVPARAHGERSASAGAPTGGADSFYVLSPVPHLGSTRRCAVEGRRARTYAERILTLRSRRLMPDSAPARGRGQALPARPRRSATS